MNDDLANSQSEILLSIGQLLKDARRKKGLSIQDVADQLRRAPKTIEDIEADRFSSDELTSFERMYIRAYARVVSVSDRDIDQLFKQMGVETGQAAVKPLQFKPEPTGTKANMRLSTFLIVGVLIFLVVIWYSLHHESSTTAVPPVNNIAQQVTDVNADVAPVEPVLTQQPADVLPSVKQITDTPKAIKPVAKPSDQSWHNPDAKQNNENE